MAAATAAAWLAAGACAAAGVGGACAAGGVLRAIRRSRRQAGGAVSAGTARQGPAARAVRFAAETSRRLAFGATSPLVRAPPRDGVGKWLAAHAKKAGIDGEVSAAGFCEARVRMALAGALAGALLGALLSAELSALLGAAGAVAGFSLLRRSILALERERAAQLERSLSEMLEVVALGLRSGLTFDRSFDLYAAHFDTELSRACARAQRRWALGLMTREEALRDFAASYDSAVLARVVENAVRSLRFGSSLTEGFESAAAEARAVHRAQVEERVAKAPVKMMVPTGTLILPAMLLLVLGPVLLELMGGF